MNTALRISTLPLFATTVVVFVMAAATALSMASSEPTRPPLLSRVLTPVMSVMLTPVLEALPGPGTFTTTASLD